jgi:hypothetical protein
MKIIHATIGSILVILGVLSLAGGTMMAPGICASTPTAAVLLNLPICDQFIMEVVVLLILGLGFIAAGAILLHKGKQ